MILFKYYYKYTSLFKGSAQLGSLVAKHKIYENGIA